MNQETYKKIRKLIILAILLYLGVNHIDVVMNAVVWGLELIIPFIIGVGVAYVLNVPMRFVEKLLFGRVLRQAGRQPYIVVKPDEQESVQRRAAGMPSGQACEPGGDHSAGAGSGAFDFSDRNTGTDEYDCIFNG